MVSDREIISGIPQKELISEIANSPTQTSRLVKRDLATSNAEVKKPHAKPVITEPISMLPELTALDPDLIPEELKKERRKRTK
ncbi:hypothetical protein OXX59_000086 [Metschnikowia pulcherrima]